MSARWATAVGISAPDSWEKYLARASDGKAGGPRLLVDLRDQDDIRLLATRDSGQSSYDEQCAAWLRKSGVPEKSSAAREHRGISIASRLLPSFDQADAANSAAAELLSRRLLQIEAATRRNPRQPDLEGLDGILDVALGEG